MAMCARTFQDAVFAMAHTIEPMVQSQYVWVAKDELLVAIILSRRHFVSFEVTRDHTYVFDSLWQRQPQYYSEHFAALRLQMAERGLAWKEPVVMPSRLGYQTQEGNSCGGYAIATAYSILAMNESKELRQRNYHSNMQSEITLRYAVANSIAYGNLQFLEVFLLATSMETPTLENRTITATKKLPPKELALKYVRAYRDSPLGQLTLICFLSSGILREWTRHVLRI